MFFVQSSEGPLELLRHHHTSDRDEVVKDILPPHSQQEALTVGTHHCARKGWSVQEREGGSWERRNQIRLFRECNELKQKKAIHQGTEKRKNRGKRA